MNKKTVVTRSVEIPEAAVEAAATACHEADFAWSSEGIHDEYWRKMAHAALEAALPYLAPAGDGGLREALTAKPFCSHTHRRLGCPYCDCNEDLQRIVAAHPAAPAVPQPTPIDLVHELRDALGLPNSALPITPKAAWEDALKHARGLAAGWCGECEKRAAKAAVPQPVDREALRAAIQRHLPLNLEGKARANGITNAVLALLGGSVLAGEQEQVAPE